MEGITIKRENISKDKCHKSKHHKRSSKNKPVYGEFIRTFTFSQAPQLPIVQPGGSFVFPIPTVVPQGVKYVEDPDRVGLLVPRGTYILTLIVNPSVGSTLNLLINGQLHSAPNAYPYTQTITETLVFNTYLIEAPLRHNNLISLVNGGTNLLTLGDVPNTKIGNTSILTHIRVQKIN
jgi:hypothetical protein